jgi:hypothetical protein
MYEDTKHFYSKLPSKKNKNYFSGNTTPRLRAIKVTDTRVMSISASLPINMEETLLETFAVCCIG